MCSSTRLMADVLGPYSDHIVLSAIQPETVAGRLSGGRDAADPIPEEDED